MIGKLLKAVAESKRLLGFEKYCLLSRSKPLSGSIGAQCNTAGLKLECVVVRLRQCGVHLNTFAFSGIFEMSSLQRQMPIIKSDKKRPA